MKGDLIIMTIQDAKQIINEYVNDPDNILDSSFLKVEPERGIKVINWRKSLYDWHCTGMNYYTEEQFLKIKQNVCAFAKDVKLYDYMFKINGIYHTFKV